MRRGSVTAGCEQDFADLSSYERRGFARTMDALIENKLVIVKLKSS